jgi:hypothetical protein
MKQLIARTLTSLTLAMVGLAATAPAQSMPVMKVKVPFEFNFGEHTFPAGNYSLEQRLQHFLVLRDSRGHVVGNAFTAGVDSSTPVNATKVKFDYSEGQHTLTEVWVQQDTSGEQLSQVKSRTNLAKHRSTDARETTGGQQ